MGGKSCREEQASTAKTCALCVSVGVSVCVCVLQWGIVSYADNLYEPLLPSDISVISELTTGLENDGLVE